MDVVGEALPAIISAVRTYGDTVLTAGEQAAASGTVSLGRRLLQKLFGGAPKPVVFEDAVANLAAAPESDDAVAALRLQIGNVLARHPELRDEIAAMLPHQTGNTVSGDGSANAGRDQNISASGGTAVGVLNIHPSSPDPTTR
ncbi:conserved hypothetical protein [Catenulispora acidiphila DSM 44928]|uniref:Uncharacterized protein n=1 Tax=Catenulispora acidiphila (strain DSM 44928 / JCM 14897 / NBRC 102108 / NRRL B-24433 / ID139908) TaxID=479433 RepID=C7PVM9_CATAD|nr:hypothetical protein [Catenulispora acidiphila]ACU69385.1 conserved hypothetical protein [Catenulispora acidiphila DSM 44928]